MAGHDGLSQEATTSIQGDTSIYHLDALGDQVFVFDPNMDMEKVQQLIDTIYSMQSGRGSEFNDHRFALLFKPGSYDLDVRVGYYMHIIGLGETPDEVTITGAVRSKSTSSRHHVLTNFWRGVENLAVVPAVEPANVWGVSQAAPMRRVHVKGDLQLHDGGYSSGGFLADSKIDGTVLAGSQQQWFTRNSEVNGWTGGAWNIMFMGVTGAPETNWPQGPVTTVDRMPPVREKPCLVWKDGKLYVFVPDVKNNSSGPSWLEGNKNTTTILVDEFFIVKQGASANTINSALANGKNLLFTPGVYELDSPINVTHPGTLIIGLGMATLTPVNGNAAMEISDVDGVTISGLIFNAGGILSATLMKVGEPDHHNDHQGNPTFLFDVFFRVGGPSQGSATTCLTINSNNVTVDHTWLWRADHGSGVGWDENKAAHGLIVNGDHVTIYGLFNEHFQEYQTIWNGNFGRTFFYQCELPYDPPAMNDWKHGGTNGYAAYKVSDKVQRHEALGLGIYCYFRDAAITEDQAIEVPEPVQKDIRHVVTFWLNGNKESSIQHIINEKGGAVTEANRKAVLD